MEILVLVELFDFRKRASVAMLLSQLNPGRGINSLRDGDADRPLVGKR